MLTKQPASESEVAYVLWYCGSCVCQLGYIDRQKVPATSLELRIKGADPASGETRLRLFSSSDVARATIFGLTMLLWSSRQQWEHVKLGLCKQRCR